MNDDNRGVLEILLSIENRLTKVEEELGRTVLHVSARHAVIIISGVIGVVFGISLIER